MPTAILILMAAMWAGLDRAGWNIPPIQKDLAQNHGSLMIAGFLGTLVGLERAVALGRGWGYAAPGLVATGGLGLLFGAGRVAWTAILAGSLGMAAIFAVIIRHRPSVHSGTMGAGALAFAVGNLLQVAGLPALRSVPWWTGFLVLMIAGERLELSRLVGLTAGRLAAYGGATGLILVGMLGSLASPRVGGGLLGFGIFALALWLLEGDVARRAIRQSGLTRYIAVSLLSGYAWLAAGGGLWFRYA